METQKAFISYKDDDDKIVRGYFILKEINSNYIIIISGKNEMLIPYGRVIKVKKEVEK